MFAEDDDDANHDNRLVGSWLMSMVEDLPDHYREAIRLAEMDGLPQAEVASRLGLSVSGAKSRIQRGRELLRRALAKCCHVEFDRRGNVVDYKSRNGCC